MEAEPNLFALNSVITRHSASCPTGATLVANTDTVRAFRADEQLLPDCDPGPKSPSQEPQPWRCPLSAWTRATMCFHEARQNLTFRRPVCGNHASSMPAPAHQGKATSTDRRGFQAVGTVCIINSQHHSQNFLWKTCCHWDPILYLPRHTAMTSRAHHHISCQWALADSGLVLTVSPCCPALIAIVM